MESSSLRRRREDQHDATSSNQEASPSQFGSNASSSDTQRYIAIPRLPPNQSQAAITRRQRVSQACEACRQRKARCFGERPRCKRCSELDIECIYSVSKVDRSIQEMKRLRDQHAIMVGVLSQLRSRVAPEDQQNIQRCLNWVQARDSPSEPGTPSGDASATPLNERQGAESNTSADVGSPEAVGILDEDVETDDKARSIGYLGKGSDLHWLKQVRERRSRAGMANTAISGPYGPPGSLSEVAPIQRLRRQKRDLEPIEPLMSSSYHLDEQTVDSSDSLDPFELPEDEVAQTLYEYYMWDANVDFPFVDSTWTLDQLTAAALADEDEDGDINTEASKYRAILNMIFAVGASYAHLIGDAQGSERDHFTYYTRARALGLERILLLEHPTFQVIQIASLMGFYFLCCSQISRSWMITGYAIRAAIALGLHVRNEDPGMPQKQKEERIRLWWALWLLERQLVALSGRSSAIVDLHCSVSRPSGLTQSTFQQFDVQDNLDIQYLNLRIDLAKITQNTIDLVYSPSVVAKSWASVQVNIQSILDDLKHWRDCVPDAFNFDKLAAEKGEHVRRGRILGFHFHISRILACRPCLCPLGFRLDGQSDSSTAFNHRIAMLCVEAAEDIGDLLPESLDAVELYRHGPWYSQVNVIMRASAVLLLMFASRPSEADTGIERLVSSSKKVIAWLREMGKHNVAAKRDWRAFLTLIQDLAPRRNVDISDIETESPPRNPSEPFNRQHSTFPGAPPEEVVMHGSSAASFASAAAASSALFTGAGRLPQQAVLQTPLADFDGQFLTYGTLYGFETSLSESQPYNLGFPTDPVLADIWSYPTPNPYAPYQSRSISRTPQHPGVATTQGQPGPSQQRQQQQQGQQQQQSAMMDVDDLAEYFRLSEERENA